MRFHYSSALFIVAIAAVCIQSSYGASLSFPKQTMAMAATGGKGVLVDFDVSDQTANVFMKCDVLEPKNYTWFGYNNGDPNLVKGKGTMECDYQLSADKSPLVGTDYISSCFLILESVYKEMEAAKTTNNAYTKCIEGTQKSNPICFDSSCLGPPTASTKKPCDSKPCANGGTCTNSGTTFTCNCPEQYTGKTCSEEVSVQDPCEAAGCASAPAGKCTVSGNTARCSCNTGYTGNGKTCSPTTPAGGGDVSVNPCLTNHGGCLPEASCKKDNLNTICTCPAGKSGDGYSYCCANNLEWDTDLRQCVDPLAPPTQPSTQPATKSSGSSTLLIIVIVLAVLVVGVGAFLFFRSQQQSKMAQQFMGSSTNAYPPKPMMPPSQPNWGAPRPPAPGQPMPGQPMPPRPY